MIEPVRLRLRNFIQMFVIIRQRIIMQHHIFTNIIKKEEMQIAIFIKCYNKYSTLNILYCFAYYVTIFASLGPRGSVFRGY